MYEAFYDSAQGVVWVVRDQIVTHHAEVPNQDEAAAVLLRWGFWMERWESHASGLGYRTSPRLEAVGMRTNEATTVRA